LTDSKAALRGYQRLIFADDLAVVLEINHLPGNLDQPGACILTEGIDRVILPEFGA
jgi:hypothetical protein